MLSCRARKSGSLSGSQSRQTEQGCWQAPVLRMDPWQRARLAIVSYRYKESQHTVACNIACDGARNIVRGLSPCYAQRLARDLRHEPEARKRQPCSRGQQKRPHCESRLSHIKNPANFKTLLLFFYHFLPAILLKINGIFIIKWRHFFFIAIKKRTYFNS